MTNEKPFTDEFAGAEPAESSDMNPHQQPHDHEAVHENPTDHDVAASSETHGDSIAEDADELDPLTKLELELASANDRWVRTEAELDNFRKRSRRELDESKKYAAAGLLTEILGVMDNLQRAIESAEKDKEGAGLLEGVKMVLVQLEHTLAQHGCQPIETVGSMFDPNCHEAVIMEPTDDAPANTVIREMRRGYKLHDRVLRPPQVVVAAPATQ